MLIDSITQAVGNTPLLRLNNIGTPNGNVIFGKCEFLNPIGGLKDRTGLFMLQEALRRGEINESSQVIEATAGNTGLGLALGVLSVGCALTLVIPKNFSTQKQRLLKALGAKIINTSSEGGMLEAVQTAQELLQKTPNAVSLRQFENPDNPLAHYTLTAREIYEELGAKVDYFVAGAGSGGSFCGVARFLKEKDSRVKAVLCDPLGSHIGGLGEGECGICSHIEGIGNAYIPNTMKLDLVDEVVKISDEEALQGVRLLAKNEGVLAGISSGATVMACLKLAQRVKNARIITLFADKLERYIDEREIF